MAIRLSGVRHTYEPGTAWARPVLCGVDLEIPRGECLGVLGRIGSGKTTLIQHLNGLLVPERGEVRVGGRTIRAGEAPPRLLYKEVGIVFQFPEKQLFADTLREDVAAGVRFAGVPPEEERERVAAALARVGFDAGRDGERPVHHLSWGEKRRAALAGVLALDPPRFVFDEPGAGLDPAARRRLLALIEELVSVEGKTVVFVSHHLDDLFRVAGRLAILHEGRIAFHGTPGELADAGDLARWGLRWPPLPAFMRTARARCGGLPAAVRSPEEAAGAVLRHVGLPEGPGGEASENQGRCKG